MKIIDCQVKKGSQIYHPMFEIILIATVTPITSIVTLLATLPHHKTAVLRCKDRSGQ